MLNVIIVDDNRIITEGLKHLIDWESFGFCVTAAARNAYQAMEFCAKNDVDVVITDIRMPEMTGLEMIKKLRGVNKNLKFIIITGYSEFEYAKTAIDYGVKGYLLKPVEEDELIGILKSIKEEHDENKRKYDSRLNYWAYTALSGKPSSEDFDLAGSIGSARCVVIRCRDDKVISNKAHAESRNTDILFDAVKSFDGINSNLAVKNTASRSIECIVPSKNNDIRTLLKDLRSHISTRADFDFYIFAGKEADDVRKIIESKNSVRDLYEIFFYSGKTDVFLYDDYTKSGYVKVFDDKALIEKIISAVKKGSGEDVKICTDKFCSEVKEKKISADAAIMYIYNVFFELGGYFGEYKIDVLKYINRFSMIRSQCLIDADLLTEFLRETLCEIIDFIDRQKDKKSLGIVNDVIEYVNSHYNDPELNLQAVADRYYINVVYLGRVFRKKIGKSFNTYVNELRIEKAKKLLASDDVKVYEVAEMIGFVDANYFTAKFTDAVGVPPTTYRNNILGTGKEEHTDDK